MAAFEIRRAGDRARTTTDWLTSNHSFSFGPHYDRANLAFGPLIALNSDVVEPGPGYRSHRHAGLEVLSWVTAGVLEHDSGGVVTQVRPGQLQYLSTGSGIEHAERSGSATEPVRVLQLWLTGRADAAPDYTVGPIPAGDWVLAAASSRAAPIRLRHVEAELHLGRLQPGAVVTLPEAAGLYVFVVRGRIELDGFELGPEDEARSAGPASIPPQPVRPAAPATITARARAEILVWAFPQLRTLES